MVHIDLHIRSGLIRINLGLHSSCREPLFQMKLSSYDLCILLIAIAVALGNLYCWMTTITLLYKQLLSGSYHSCEIYDFTIV